MRPPWDKMPIQQMWESTNSHARHPLSILAMAQPSGSAGWRIEGDSSKDQDKFAFGNECAQYWMEKTMDEAESNKVSTAKFGPTAYTPETGGMESFSIPNLTLGSDSGLSGDHSQWNQNQSPTQAINWQGSDAKSSYGSEYNFTVEELVNNGTNIFEADIANDWPYSDFEDEPAGGGAYNPQDAIGGLGENQSLNPGLGYRSTKLHSAVSRDNATSFESIDASSKIEQGLWSSILDANLPLEPHPRRSMPMRRQNVPATRPHAQPKSHPCDLCSNTFVRAGDLRRHYGVHFPDRRTFHCRVEGCDRNGQRGFYRRDKFRDHRRQAHGVGSEGELVLLEGVWISVNL
jgi:hypothetical protein